MVVQWSGQQQIDRLAPHLPLPMLIVSILTCHSGMVGHFTLPDLLEKGYASSIHAAISY